MRVEDIEDGVCPISLGFVKLPTDLFSARGRKHRDLLPDDDDDHDHEEEKSRIRRGNEPGHGLAALLDSDRG